MEMGLVNRERCVDGRAAAMDDDRAWEGHVNKSRPKKVERHLVGDSRRLRRDGVKHATIVCRRLCEERALVPARARAKPRRSAFVPEIQFAAWPYVGMHGDDLLDESCAGPRHADDQHWCRITV